MIEGSSRRFLRTAGAPRVRHVLLLLAVFALAGSVAGGSARADSTPDATAASFVRVCSDPAPGDFGCFALRRTTGVIANMPVGMSPAAAAAAVSGFGPADIDDAYKLPTSNGAGRLVAIVDAQDDPNAASDLNTYRAQFGLPACTTANGCFRKINQNGATSPLPSPDTGWAGEIMLDLEMVSATCPLCHIVLVEANTASTTNLGTAVNQAVAQGAIAVSNSYGGPESSSDPTTATTYYRHPGIAITVSSGDSGYGVEFPASSPYVTSVGGTALKRASNARGWTESVWSTSSSEGAGSGCSRYETKPTFQTDTGCTRRTVADVSAVADPATGVAVYDSYGSGGWTVFGGTSVASPIIAGVYALATPPAAGVNAVQYPYANPGALFDVTTGSNGSCSPAYLCTGEVGYDGPTGLGTPNGVAAFGPAGTATNDFSVAVSPTSATVAPGGGTSATVSTAVTSGSAESVSLSASGLPSGATASFAPTSVTSGGSSTLTISTSSVTPAGTYPITIAGTAASGSHTATFTLTVRSATANDFSVSLNPTSASVVAGSGTSSTVSTAVTSGSSETVSFSASGLPSGATASFSPASVSSGSSSTLTIGTSTSTPAGTYTVTVTGTATTGSHSASFSLTVTAASTCAAGQKLANPGFESGATSWASTTGVIGQNGSNGEPTHSGSWNAWLDGYGRSHTDTLSQTVTIPTGCTTYTLSFYLHIDSAEATTSVAYDKLTVTLGSTTLATYSNLNKASGYALRSFNVAGSAGQTVTLTFKGVEDTSLQTSFVIDDTALTVG
jgi:hypothetical protein